MNFHEITLANIADGKAVSKFNFELGRVLENCKDVATEANAVREVVLKVKIKPNSDRTKAEITVVATSKIAPDAPSTDQVIFSGSGAFVSSSRQLTLDEIEDNNVEEFDKETGEVKA